VVGAALVAAGCGSGSSKPAANASFTLEYISDATGNQGYDIPTNTAFAAAVKAVNARGGIKGHLINVLNCDTTSSANGSAACGQKAVSDHAFAIISFASSGAYLPLAQQAGIPVLSEGITTESWTSPVSFMLSNGLIGGSAGYVALLKSQGCQHIGMVATVAPGSAKNIQSLSDSMATEAKALGVDYKGYVSAPITAPDMAPYATQAVDKGYECLIPLAFGPGAVSMMTSVNSLVQAGKFKKVGICICSITSQVRQALTAPIQAMGDAAVLSLSIESGQDTANPAVRQWAKDMADYNGGTSLEFQGGMQWAELQLLVHAGDAVYPNVTAAKVLNYLNGLHSYWPGISPPVDLSKAPANPYGPRVFASWVAPTKFTDGINFTRTAPFVSILTDQTNDNPVPAKCNNWVAGACAS